MVLVETAPRQAPRFVPPAAVPAAKDPPSLILAARSPLSQIEGWPRAVFEADTYRPPFPGAPLFVMEPQAIRAVLLEQADNFPQGALFRRMMSPAWGRGMLTAQGAAWRWQRHAAALAFRPRELSRLTPHMTANAEAMLERWRTTEGGASVDMAAEMARLTFEIILDAMLSGGEDFDRAGMQARAQSFFADIGGLRLSYFLAPDAYHARRPNIASAQRQPLIDDIQAMVRRRRRSPPRDDLVDLLFAARDPETDQGLDDDLIADNLLGFILAGHETTALGLTWALFLIASHDDTARRIAEEVETVAGRDPIAADHVDRLVFTRQVVSEALRLYPPGYMLTRVARHETMLSGVRIKPGGRVNIPVYAVHRRRNGWDDPDVFDPDRFAPDRPAPDRYLYLPFGAGPRICLGQAFAMIEMVVVLATFVRAATFAVKPGHAVWPVAQLALRPRGGMPMTVAMKRA